MRRVTQILALTFLMLIPATGVPADGCPTISGKAYFDFGRTSQGMANVVYDGQKMLVPFRAIAYTGSDIFFEWNFPQGDVTIVEHATNFTPIGPTGVVGVFDTSLDVIRGGSGTWQWTGTANGAGGLAVIKSLSGTLCIDSG